MAKWTATLDKGERLNFGGLGTARVMENRSVVADSEQEARAKLKEEYPGYRIHSLAKVWAFHITLRAYADKRKRETFIVNAVDEHEAKRALRNNASAQRFAKYGYGKKWQERALVKIERKEATL